MRTHDRKNARARFIADIFFLFLGNYLPSIVSSCSAKGSCLTVIRSKSQFWSILYTWGWSLHPRANRIRLSLFLSCVRLPFFLSPSFPFPFNLHVHPVNYFVSGYLQRAVNSCRADYTDRFIALVSQSNVRNAPIPTTHSPSLMLFLFSFTPPYFRVLLFLRPSLSLSRCNVISLASRESV